MFPILSYRSGTPVHHKRLQYVLKSLLVTVDVPSYWSHFKVRTLYANLYASTLDC